jgi:hypothetical protein
MMQRRTKKGEQLPACRPASEIGAVEAALRASAEKTTSQIFNPTLVFDSLEEAYEFYNLYSWEVGFGIRYGNSNINGGNKYKTKQIIECGNAVCRPTLLSNNIFCFLKNLSSVLSECSVVLS